MMTRDVRRAPAMRTGPLTMFGPDFPFPYDRFVAHRAGLGRVPAAARGAEVAIVGAGLAGTVAAYELLKLGLTPVVYECERVGGRMRTHRFPGGDAYADLGAMRFPLASTTLFHYLDAMGLRTEPFPNPLAPQTPSTVVEIDGERHYARRTADLPRAFREVERAWAATLEERARFGDLTEAVRTRDAAAIASLWHPLVVAFDDETFSGFLARSTAFRALGYRARERFGHVGFGTGGWDSDFPNSILEILRVAATGAECEHRRIVGGAEGLPRCLWQRAVTTPGRERERTSLADLHGGSPRPGVARIAADPCGGIAITDVTGAERRFDAAILTPQVGVLTTRIECGDSLFDRDCRIAMRRTHFMQASKTFVMVDRPFWRDIAADGRHAMSMTLTDRTTRGTYLLDHGEGRPGVICLSYTWNDDALRWLTHSPAERVRLMLRDLREIYPDVDVAGHIVGDPVTVSWEAEPAFMGAFKANLPGQYRYQRRLFTHFAEPGAPAAPRAIFLAGDGISWTAGWAEGAVTTALNAVAGVVRSFGGTCDAGNPDPIACYDACKPLLLGDRSPTPAYVDRDDVGNGRSRVADLAF